MLLLGALTGCTGLAPGIQFGSPNTQSSKEPEPAPPTAPRLTSVLPDNGGRGAVVTIVGENLAQKNLKVTINGSFATDVSQLPDGTVRVSIPFGATTGNIIAQVGGLVSNGLPFFVIKKLVLSEGDRELLLGQHLSYSASAIDTGGTPVQSPAVAWSVGDGSVAGIDQHGVVSARSTGDTSVVASSGTASDSALVHVFYVGRILLEPTTLRLNAQPQDGTIPASELPSYGTIRATVIASDRGNRQVSWTCSDPSIATIDSHGNVSAARTSVGGSAIIFATSVDDPTVYSTASITVTVNGVLHLGVN